MQIRYLELENIKSYGPRTRIDLTAGLNAICGHNGSGKSTVLEAIGFVLFDFLPYQQSAFQREGEKNGFIRLGLLGRDAREYEITRRVGGAYSLNDAETGDRIADRRPAVLEWIRERALDIEPETDLEALFKNAVGVPQGLMTADFQGTGSTRKSIFDPLLRVEEYRNAYEELRDTERFLRDRTGQVEKDIAALRTDTDRIAEREEEEAAVRSRLEQSVARLQLLEEQRDDLLRQKGELDETERQLQDALGNVRGAEYEVRRLDDARNHAVALLAAAREAQRVLQLTGDGYRRVIEARKQIAGLDVQRLERDGLLTQLSKAQADRQGHYGRIQALDRQVQEAIHAADAAAKLLDAVAKQESLEAQRMEAHLVARDAARLDAEVARLSRERQKVLQSREARDGQLKRARAAGVDAERMEPVQREIDGVTLELAALDLLAGQRDTVQAEGKALKERREALLQMVAEHARLSERLSQLQPVAAQYDALEGEERDVREERIRVLAEIEYRQYSRDELRQSQCPILELTCPVVAHDPTVLTRFEARGEELRLKATALESTVVELTHRLAAARDARMHLQKVEVGIASLGRPQAELEDAEGELRVCMQRFTELKAALDAADGVRSRLKSLQAEMEMLRNKEKEAGQVSALEELQQKESEALAALEGDLKRLEEERARVAAAQAEVKALEVRLQGLGDPRQEQQRLLALAARRAGIEREVDEAQRHLKVAADRVKAITGHLTTFESLDEDIQRQRQIETAHAEDHDRYLQHKDVAAAAEERCLALENVEKELAAAEAALLDASRDRDRLERAYDSQRHATLKLRCEEAVTLVTREQEQSRYLQEELGRMGAELERLRRLRDKLRAHQDERDELAQIARAVAFIRDTIRSAGPAVTETLLAHISEGANDIFAEIMDDHAAELRWDRDYEVLVQRGPEVRKFAQLSGGEQMSAALAVRLALLKEMSEVDFAFFDEPTQNMDGERRTNLAGQIRQVRGFDQLIVISHDDTFEHHTDNLIRLSKVHEETRVEPG